MESRKTSARPESGTALALGLFVVVVLAGQRADRGCEREPALADAAGGAEPVGERPQPVGDR